MQPIDPLSLGELGEGTIKVWHGGRAWIAVRGFMFGQYRIQCWIDLPYLRWPDITTPEC